jgi:hypothetical protein
MQIKKSGERKKAEKMKTSKIKKIIQGLEHITIYEEGKTIYKGSIKEFKKNKLYKSLKNRNALKFGYTSAILESY